MAYAVYTTETFDKEVEEFEQDKRERVNKLFPKLRDNPYTGDQVRFKFFREKRIDEKRVYFLVYDDIKIVLFVGTSDKKDQQKTINHISQHFVDFRKYAEKLAN